MRLLYLLTFGFTAIFASQPVKVWVELRDKGPSSVAGRAWEDLPVYAPYLQQLRHAGFTPDISLKWQNRVSGWIDPKNISDLNRMAIVRHVEGMPHKAPYNHLPRIPVGSGLAKAGVASAFGSFQQAFDTTQASLLRTALPAGQSAGQGLRIAVIDVDFDLKHEAFAHLKQAGLIVDQRDFVANKNTVVRDTFTESHGAAVLSLLAGKTATFEGLVPDAKYLLYRAENGASETYVEEDYVAAAMERAVDSGAQVISISLGYRYDYSDGSPDIPYASMNGRTRPSSIAALGAARRGVLLCVSMGNEGPTRASGPTITAPADADSVLSVGILDLNLKPCSYSGTGPTYDHRVKPDVASIGPNACATPTADPKTTSGVEYQGGTSFAAPVVAGIGALLRQLHPTISAQTIRLALMSTASKTLHPDSASGYGLVRANEASRILSSGGSGIGSFVWDRASSRATMRWRPGLNFSGTHLWDLRGRDLPVHAGATGPVFWMDPGSSRAAGFYCFRIPSADSSNIAP